MFHGSDHHHHHHHRLAPLRESIEEDSSNSGLAGPGGRHKRDSAASAQSSSSSSKRNWLNSAFSFRGNSGSNSLDDNILKQSALTRTARFVGGGGGGGGVGVGSGAAGVAAATASAMGISSGSRNISSAMPFKRGTTSSSTTAATSTSNTITATSTAALPSSLISQGINTGTGSTTGSDHDKPGRAPATTYRRYRVGDSVLVCNIQQNPSLANNLVNRYGYPAGGGVTPEEQRGPYIFVLATVKKVHFEEDAEYYTVTRADTGADQRSDAEWMEPLRTARGEAAALRAATDSQLLHTDRGIPGASFNYPQETKKENFVVKWCLCLCWNPISWLFGFLARVVGARAVRWGQYALDTTKRQAQLCLNGAKPYRLVVRVTGVNMLVLCSFWYVFIDQARIAFFRPAADHTLAFVSLIVWIVLVMELLFESFIRPDGYRNLIVSEKAFAPSTVRYINALHLMVEAISLGVFVPEFLCILTNTYSCGDRPDFSFLNALFLAVLGPTRWNALLGRAYLAMIRLRVFGLVRHFKKMWVNHKLDATVVGKAGELQVSRKRRVTPKTRTKKGSDTSSSDAPSSKEDALINASNIGTALMVTNSHRTLMILCAIVGLFPLLTTIQTNGGTNRVGEEMALQLQATTVAFQNSSSTEECQFVQDSLVSWVMGVTAGARLGDSADDGVFVLYVKVEPTVGCYDFLTTHEGVLTSYVCDLHNEDMLDSRLQDSCDVWMNTTTKNSSTITTTTYAATIDESTDDFLANKANIRTGAIESESFSLSDSGETVKVVVKYNQTESIRPAAMSCFLLQVCLLICVLGGLTVLRRDSVVLVLGPLRQMLIIVARYAKNPLSTVKANGNNDDSDEEDETEIARRRDSQQQKLGNFETEQLINAVSKITDLLRKCWGVAGADIISTNLAAQEGALEVFNPTVPGKSVYAVFAFAGINGFDHTLRQLQGDVMILINDVANVLHGEVFRWGLGDTGQCNKNLGATFLMVFRIGLVKSVIEKLERATNVVFQNNTSKSGVRRRNRNASKHKDDEGSISQLALSRNVMSERRRKSQRQYASRAQLSSVLQRLPGIQVFTDRAVIGMLKTFAGIHRDNKLLAWKNDFRLGAGVGAFSVNMIFGMDAGWAVEGAVGSEYKIDATYLSPHVNMAARMMSACKQFGVSILLSQAIHELMSNVARSKLRHIDTVTVKGSTLKQRIFTYDARHKGVDFFLFSRSDEQADLDSDRYSTEIWNTDQDLTAMRQHVTEAFEKEFNKGRDAYLAGNWTSAMRHLEAANEMMVETVMDQGYIQDELNELRERILDGENAKQAQDELKNETGDGPSRRLMAYMQSEKLHVPPNWKGYRPLTSK